MIRGLGHRNRNTQDTGACHRNARSFRHRSDPMGQANVSTEQRNPAASACIVVYHRPSSPWPFSTVRGARLLGRLRLQVALASTPSPHAVRASVRIGGGLASRTSRAAGRSPAVKGLRAGAVVSAMSLDPTVERDLGESFTDGTVPVPCLL